MDDPVEPKLRLFFALWPEPQPAATAGVLARDVARETGGRPVPADRIHLTLAFLGKQPESIVPALKVRAAAVALAPFTLRLRNVGCWRKAGVAWLAPEEPVPELVALQIALVRSLREATPEFEDRRFLPHVTLVRRIESITAQRLVRPLEWQVRSFALVASQLNPDGSRYRVLASWP